MDFLRFCQRNPKPCPLVGVSDTGDPMLPTLGRDIDIRTDVPKYRVFREGQLTDEVTDITNIWHQLLKFHQKRGLRIQPQVTTTFNTINTLVRKI